MPPNGSKTSFCDVAGINTPPNGSKTPCCDVAGINTPPDRGKTQRCGVSGSKMPPNGSKTPCCGVAFCRKCAHFYVTWDTSFPNGCRLYGFKSSATPGAAVYEATGGKCKNFIENPRFGSRGAG